MDLIFLHGRMILGSCCDFQVTCLPSYCPIREQQYDIICIGMWASSLLLYVSLTSQLATPTGHTCFFVMNFFLQWLHQSSDFPSVKCASIWFVWSIVRCWGWSVPGGTSMQWSSHSGGAPWIRGSVSWCLVPFPVWPIFLCCRYHRK